ncbi:hypothetical protein D3C71_1853470 [compost metagenome]
MRFVDDDEVEVTPVERGQINAIHTPAVTGKICMRQHGIAKAILKEWVQIAVVLG